MIAFTYQFILPNLNFKHRRMTLAIIYDSNNIINSETIKTKLKPFTENLIIKNNENAEKELSELLLNLSTSLPIIVLLEDGKLRAVIVGIPSDSLWEQIQDKLTLPGKPFLAFSVREELLLWRCFSCPPHGRLVEGLRDLSKEEIEKIREVVGV